MKAVQVSRAGGDLEVVERDIPDTGPGQVRIRVQACGVCHSDMFTKEGLFPGISYPRVPGHEVTGIIDAVGSGVKGWSKGDRVGVGWHGGQDGTCTACRKGDFANCANVLVCGLSYDGGYKEYMIAPVEALARIPESLDPVEAAPLMCAGLTTFNALRHSGAMVGDLVAVQGVGGLGHLGIQFAKKAGYRVAAVGRGTQNAAIAQKLGADLYIDSAATDAAAQLQKPGGASVVLATAPSGKAMSSLLPGLTANGTLVVVGASEDLLEVSTALLILGRRNIKGWSAGTPSDSEDTTPGPVAFGPGNEENGHMKNRMAPWLMLLAVAYCPVARTQAQQSVPKQAPTAGEQDNREKNFKEYIELLRADVRHQKAEIMGAMMALNAADAAKFWPIYSEYDSALNKLNDLKVANIKDYAQNYNNMTDAKADELIQNAMSYRKQRSELLANYYGRVKGALGAIQAARFVQIEDQLLLLIDLQVAASLPVAGQGS